LGALSPDPEARLQYSSVFAAYKCDFLLSKLAEAFV